MEKITMKVDKSVHQKLQMVKAYMGTKTFDETLKELTDRFLELAVARSK